jgi:hypothetical protein
MREESEIQKSSLALAISWRGEKREKTFEIVTFLSLSLSLLKKNNASTQLHEKGVEH